MRFSWYPVRYKTDLTHRYQVRLRDDGDYDVRVIGSDAPCIRGVPAARIHAEFTYGDPLLAAIAEEAEVATR